jgi:chemotaxis protein CheC
VTLSERQIDVLKEIANIGTGHAATALSQLVTRKIMISVPRAEAGRVGGLLAMLGDPRSIVACVSLSILGDVTGRIFMILPRDGALKLVDLLLKQAPGSTKILNEMGHSAIKEAGNILTGSYLTALSKFLRMLLLQTVPNLYFDVAEVVVPAVTEGLDPGAEIVAIRTHFLDDNRTIEGLLALLPDPPSLERILKATGTQDG